MRHNKTILSLATAGMMLLILVSCGGNKSGKSLAENVSGDMEEYENSDVK